MPWCWSNVAEEPPEMNAHMVTVFLKCHKEFLNTYVQENVPRGEIERWVVLKVGRERNQQCERRFNLSKWKFHVHTDKRQMFERIIRTLHHHPTHEQVLYELGTSIGSDVCVDGFNIFIVNQNNKDIMQLISPTQDNERVKIVNYPISCLPQVAIVANVKKPLPLSYYKDSRKMAGGQISSQPHAKYVLFLPIPQTDNDHIAVMEMWRENCPFEEEDQAICHSYLVWGGIALHYAQLFMKMDQQRNLDDFLLDVVKSIFQDMVSIDTVVTKIMDFAQKLVHADRASLFLVDSKAKELYSTVFDLGSESTSTSEPGTSQGSTSHAKPKKEIRFPLGTGIAGHVAMTGEVLNIKDAYMDKRFNRQVDVFTGYKTKTILCMPIYILGAVIGVVQMVNKRGGCFTKEDEKAFQMFAVYCGLALHHAKLYDKIKRSEQKYKVALEVLSYHNTCANEEVAIALRDGIPLKVVGLDDFYFSPFAICDYDKATNAIYMFKDLFGLNEFDRTALVKFVLTVKKNYRKVPYHNWTHGFSVANTMYNILKRTNIFTKNERVALFIAALCHDLDHRGKNNKFMSETASPLASIYSTSTMEHHHFNQTITILQQAGHDVFSKQSKYDYKQILDLVKHCILATDLALFFPNSAYLAELINERKFDWKKEEHRLLALAISMTSADLCASAKPWDIQVETVKVIFQEFYQQGDAERSAGRAPIPMMDRRRPEQQAASQVGFLSDICVPCYKLLNDLVPEMHPLLTMCQENLEKWSTIRNEVAEWINKMKTEGKSTIEIPSHLYVFID